MCQSCMHNGSRPSSISQNYKYCLKLPRLSCALTAFCIPSSHENEISQTVRTLETHIDSRNVDIHRLRMTFPSFDAFLRQNILLTKHWKCKFCLHFWLLLCETGSHSNCFSYSTTGGALDRIGRRGLANSDSEGRIFISAHHTHERFLFLTRQI